MKRKTEILLLLAITLVISACNVRYANEEKGSVLTIYTDFLTSDDSTWIDIFRDKNGIPVRLVNINDSLLMSQNPSPDLYLYHNMLDMKVADNENALFRFKTPPFSELLADKYISNENSFFAIAKAPYLFYRINDTLHRFSSYDELTYSHLGTYWKTDLSLKELVPFVTAIAVKKKSNGTDVWIKKIISNLKRNSDTSQLSSMFFSTKANLFNKGYNDISRLEFPNQRRSGSINNYITVGIAGRSPNFNYARDFIAFLLQHHIQIQIREKHHVYPVSSLISEKSYMENRSSLKELERYLIKTSRSLRKAYASDTSRAEN